MKNIIFTVLIVMCGIGISDCLAQIPVKKDDLVCNELKNAQRTLNEMPCLEDSYDTMEEIRGLGIAEGITEVQAKDKAIREAHRQILCKMPKKMVITTNSESGTYTETIYEDIVTDEQTQLTDFTSEIMCYKIVPLQEGAFRAYVVLRVLKSELVEKNSIMSLLSK